MERSGRRDMDAHTKNFGSSQQLFYWVCLEGWLVTLMEDWVSSQWVVGKANHITWMIELNSWDASCLF